MDNYHFKNWAQTYQCHPEKFFEPSDYAELRSILRRAREEGRKIRMVGCGHSPSDLCLTNDFMISTRKFDRILNVDLERKTIRAQAGVLLTDLVQHLKTQNLALSVLPALGELTLGGVISTSTHGSGCRYTTMCGLVNSITLLTSDDRILECTRENEHSDLFHAACGGLGCLGVILEVQMQCEDYYNLKCLRYPMKFDDFVRSFDEVSRETDHFKANFVPYTNEIIVSATSRTKIEPIMIKATAYNRLKAWFWYEFVLMHVLQFLYFVALYIPALAKWVNRAAYVAFFAQTEYVVDNYERVAFINCLYHQYVSEWIVERDKVGEALVALKSLIERERIPAHMPIEIRCIRADRFWLSPAYGRDVCSINLIAYCPYDRTPPYQAYWMAFQRIMRSMGARPHLAKGHRMNRDEMMRAYPKFRDFLNLRQAMDKEGMFVNEYLERLFY